MQTLPPAAKESKLEESHIGRRMLSHKGRNHLSPCLETHTHSHLHMGRLQVRRTDSGTYRIIRSRVAALDLFVPSASLSEMPRGLYVAILRRGLMRSSLRFMVMALTGTAEDSPKTPLPNPSIKSQGNSCQAHSIPKIKSFYSIHF